MPLLLAYPNPRDVAAVITDPIDAQLRDLLMQVLGLTTARVATFDPDTELFGALPELDSMAVATLLTGIEERFDVLIEDDGVEAEDFASFGNLLAFVRRTAQTQLAAKSKKLRQIVL